ncbi:Piwi domain-containing protein [Sporocytophaga sp.]|uniref:argonaute/piwi family protein n=1 Tax=Sporocytophaga sp. TaxID=2231183 RepID=UPI0025E5052A|nr:Piwi domain-containing protein [Sporocytophaga sp.]
MITNIFPIEIDFDSFQISRIPYEDGLLQKLRKDYNQTHSFFKNQNYIYISRNEGDDLNIGNVVTLKVDESEEIISSLIKHIFFRSFKANFPEIIPLEFYPFSFMSRQSKHDFVHDLLPENLRGVIGYKKQTEIQTRVITINDKRSHAFVINSFYKWSFTRSCLDLYKEKFNLSDLSIIHSIPIDGLKNIIAPDESLIGTFKSTDGKNAIIDTNRGDISLPLEELFINKSKYNIENYLRFKLGEEKTNKIFEEISSKNIERFNAKKYYDDISSTGKLISKIDFQNQDGFTFKVSNTSILPDNHYKLNNPTYIFDPSSIKTSKNSDFKGLNEYGPYDSQFFSAKEPKILVICHKNNRGGFASFLAKLKDGIPNSTYFSKGFLTKYHIHKTEFIIDEVENYSISSYLSTINKYVKNNLGRPFDLAIVETKNEFKTLSIESNPYYQIKAHLLSLNIPVQFITNQNVRKSDNYLDSVLNAMTLQIYAKMGGTPWILPSNQNIDREIIVGIGSSMIRKNRYVGATQTKIVGITTFFNADGRYLFGNKCRDVNYDEYFEEMLQNLRTSIHYLSSKDGWNPGDTVRIIFHIFKPIKDIEATVVDKLIKEFSQYHIVYAFLTISEAHPYILFDSLQTGINTKGQYIPERGTNLILDNFNCLLQMKGPKDIKTVKQGLSKPILIKLNEKSTFQDLNYLTQQIYSFTNLSWRSFLSIQMPVTIYYSDIIAKLLSRLRKINGWQPEVINTDLKYKKWFL